MKEPKAQPPSFLEILDEVYTQEDKKHSENAKEGYRHNPSSATMVTEDGQVIGACLRSLYYKATKEVVSDAKELTTKLQGDFGNGIHDRIAAKLQKSDRIKIVPESPGKVFVDYLTKEVSFRLDGLVTHKGEQGCLEIKTMQSYGLNKMVKEGGPKEAHILQVLCYFGTNPDLRWASLVYFGRDNAFRAEYHIYKDPETERFMIRGITPNQREKEITHLSFDKIVARWKELEEAVEKKELPRRDFKAVLTKEGTVTDKRTKNGVDYKTSYQCSYCSWQTKCWAEPGAEEDAVKLGR
jgi:hypothetical protein